MSSRIDLYELEREEEKDNRAMKHYKEKTGDAYYDWDYDWKNMNVDGVTIDGKPINNYQVNKFDK